MELPTFVPTYYKISTITATGCINTIVDLDSLFENLSMTEIDNKEGGIVYTEYGSKKTQTMFRGISKKPKGNKNQEKKKRFDNQVTVIYKVYNDECDDFYVNTKIFKNGNIQMTGLRRIEQGIIVIDHIVNVIQTIYHTKDDNIVGNINELQNCNYRVRLINCDFRTGFELKRDNLYKIIMTKYAVTCSYEPCIYPGVKIQYWWNNTNPIKDGCCYCKSECSGKGTGVGDGQCKKITIAVFQSGCIIITGGQSIEQIVEAYNFTCNCIRDNIAGIFKPPMVIPDELIKKRKIYIKKSCLT